MPLLQIDGDNELIAFNSGVQIYQIDRFWQFDTPLVSLWNSNLKYKFVFLLVMTQVYIDAPPVCQYQFELILKNC